MPLFNHNKEEILRSAIAGCAECGETFLPRKINVWIDCGQTALCPECGSDSVVADANQDKLRALHERYC